MENHLFEKLQLRQLGKSGELLNVINCHAGKVTVFRANSDRELQGYQQAMSGRPGPDRISILLDQQPFQTEEHTLIGFGDTLALYDGTSYDYLKSWQIEKSAITQLALASGLESYLNEDCRNLTADLRRRLELTAALNTRGKVLVLNSPFEPIASSWREHFAELISDHARLEKQLIVVTKLVYRPECWIDNETIIRVQVGDNVKRTIGFGQDSSTTNEMIHSLRKMLKDQDSVEKLVGALKNNQPYQELEIEPTIPTVRILPRTTLLATLIVAAVLLLYYLGPMKQIEPPKEQIAIKDQNKIEKEIIPQKENQPVDEILTRKQQPSLKTKPAQIEKEFNPHTVIGQYPDDIKDAITNSITGQFDPDATTAHKQSTLPLITSEIPEKTMKKSPLSKTNLFVLLQAASNTGTVDNESVHNPQSFAENEPWMHRHPSINSNIQDNQDEAEAKRQLVHQRFLDAIKRASEKRAQPESF